MAQPDRVFIFPRKSVTSNHSEQQDLLRTLAHTRVLINQAYTGFNNTQDDDLIESYVYEINALQARYNYLLRRIKELEAPV